MKLNLKITLFSLICVFASCNKDEVFPLISNAGPDQVVKPLEQVTLDGTQSSGSEGFNYLWEYDGIVPEDEINLQNNTSANPTFTPPKAGLYAFTLNISSGSGSSSDVVLIEATGASVIGGVLVGNVTLTNIVDDPELPDYYIDTDLIVSDGITLTIESHVNIEVADGQGIIVNGSLTNSNGEDYFEDIDLNSTSGWKGILVDGGTLNIDGFSINNAGSSVFEDHDEASAILFAGTPEIVWFSNIDFKNSSSHDILVESEVSGYNSMEAITFSAKVPVKAPIDFIENFRGQFVYPASYDYIHLIPNNIEKAHLLPDNRYYFFYTGKYFIDGSFWSKSEVYSQGDVIIYMKENSSLIFEATTSLGSRYTEAGLITGIDGVLWNGIAAKENISLKLNNVIISYAGASPVVGGPINSTVKAAVYQQGKGTGWIWESTIRDIDGFGFYQDAEDDVYSYFAIRDSEFINTANAAIRTNSLSVLTTIGSGVYCDLPENVPGCLIEQDGSPQEFIWPEIENSYYLIDADINFNTLRNINFKSGAHLKFKAGRSLNWIVNGSYDIYERFTVEGTADKPVVFEGATNTPGSWGGLVLEGHFNLNHLHIKNGGEFIMPGASTKANIFFDYQDSGSTDFWKTFTYCVVSGSDGYGIVLSSSAIDFDFEDPAKNNTFSDNGLGNIIRE